MAFKNDNDDRASPRAATYSSRPKTHWVFTQQGELCSSLVRCLRGCVGAYHASGFLVAILLATCCAMSLSIGLHPGGELLTGVGGGYGVQWDDSGYNRRQKKTSVVRSVDVRLG